jgi:hypothetical protein
MGWHWGILAGSGAGGAGAYELISTTVLSSTSASVTFSSITSSYKHLQLRMITRNASSGTNLPMITFNSSSTGYSQHRLYGSGSAVFSDANTSTTQIIPFTGPGTNDTTGIFMPAVIDILDYAATTKNKTLRAFAGAEMSSTGDVVGIVSGLWANTAAISSLNISALTGTFSIGSRFSLYGIKG